MPRGCYGKGINKERKARDKGTGAGIRRGGGGLVNDGRSDKGTQPGRQEIMVIPTDVNRINGASVEVEFGTLINTRPIGDAGPSAFGLVNNTRYVHLTDISDPTKETLGCYIKLSGQLETDVPICLDFTLKRPDGTEKKAIGQACVGTPASQGYDWWNWIILGSVWTGKPYDILAGGTHKITISILQGDFLSGYYDLYFFVDEGPKIAMAESFATTDTNYKSGHIIVDGKKYNFVQEDVTGARPGSGGTTYLFSTKEGYDVVSGSTPGWIHIYRSVYGGEYTISNYLKEPEIINTTAGHIKGKVTNALFKTPLPLVSVNFSTFSTITDAAGNYDLMITSGFSGPVTYSQQGYEPKSIMATAGPGSEVILNVELMQATETPPPEGWTSWFEKIMNATPQAALDLIAAVPNYIKNAILSSFVGNAAAILSLEKWGDWLGDKFAEQYPEWESYRNGPKGSLTLIALLGIIAGIVSFGTYIGHLRKEIPEGPGISVWALIEQGKWEEANIANQRYRKVIDVVANSWFSYFTWLNPITAIFAETTKKSQLEIADSYQILIDEHLKPDATLAVNSDPAGAKIFVDDVYTYNTTNTTIKVKGGAHRITLKLEGYKDYMTDVAVISGGYLTVVAELTSLTTEEKGSVFISSTPTGAKIYKNGEFLFENTNTTLTLPTGTYEFTLKLKDYEDASKIITITKNTTTAWNAVLKRIGDEIISPTPEVTPQPEQTPQESLPEAENVISIPLEPTGKEFNAWKTTIKAVDANTGEELNAWILINDVFMKKATPFYFYLAGNSVYNVKLRLKGYSQGEVTFTTKPLPEA